jgi:lipopolysaccharide export LptBFGC system permease protein LptF
MTLGFIFWLLMLLALVFGVYTNRGAVGTPFVWGGSLFWWILLFLLGWKVFVWPIAG